MEIFYTYAPLLAFILGVLWGTLSPAEGPMGRTRFIATYSTIVALSFSYTLIFERGFESWAFFLYAVFYVWVVNWQVKAFKGRCLDAFGKSRFFPVMFIPLVPLVFFFWPPKQSRAYTSKEYFFLIIAVLYAVAIVVFMVILGTIQVLADILGSMTFEELNS